MGKKVFIFGSRGVVGSALEKEFSGRGYETVSPTHSELPLQKREAVEERLTHLRPSIVINCAALSGHDLCEEDSHNAFLLNALAVKNLAKAANAINAILIHVSTSAVFDGRKQDAYTEEDCPSPINVYGGTKLLGENMARQWCEKCYVFRLPMLFGPRRNEGMGFLDKMLYLLQNGSRELQVSTDEYHSPTCSSNMAQGMVEIVEGGTFGLYHISSNAFVSLYDMAQEIVSVLKAEVTVKPVRHDFFPRKAAIPFRSSVSTSRFRKNS